MFSHKNHSSLAQVEMTNISKYKEKLLQLNVAVHRFLTENKDYNVSSLKMDVSELYRIWNEIRNRLVINYFIQPIPPVRTQPSSKAVAIKIYFK